MANFDQFSFTDSKNNSHFANAFHQPFDWLSDMPGSNRCNSRDVTPSNGENSFVSTSRFIDFQTQTDIYTPQMIPATDTCSKNYAICDTSDGSWTSSLPHLEISAQNDVCADPEKQLDYKRILEAIEPYLQVLAQALHTIVRELAGPNQPGPTSGAPLIWNPFEHNDFAFTPERTPAPRPENDKSHHPKTPVTDKPSDRDNGQKDHHPVKPESTSDSATKNSNNNRGEPKTVKEKDDPPDRPKDTTPPRHSDRQENDNSQNTSRYEDIGISRGRTIFRDDFNGNRGEKPNQNVYDTAHIGGDGKTRQRGESNREDGIISTNNTLLDGNGNLQLFPERKRTYDDVANEYVNYTKGSMNTTDGLHFNLKDHPEGVVVEVRAKHPTRDGAKFNALWIMTEHWAADASKGQKQGDTVEYDAAEGGGAEITVHHPTKSETGQYKDHRVGGARPGGVDFEDGKFHTYTVVITPNDKTGRGDVVQYVDGNKVYSQDGAFPGDKDLHLRSSLEISPAWTHKTLTGAAGMDSDAAGVIDYVDISELARKSKS